MAHFLLSTEESAQSIVGVMLGEPVSTVNDELALSAIGEIGNMITGNAAARLAQLGYTCNISPPVIINPAEVGSPQSCLRYWLNLPVPSAVWPFASV